MKKRTKTERQEQLDRIRDARKLVERERARMRKEREAEERRKTG